MRALRVRLVGGCSAKHSAVWALVLLRLTLAADRALPCPDAQSYFPLLPGSYWLYEDEIDHEVSPDGGEKRSVTNLVRTDSGYVAEVRVTRDAGVRELGLIYYCDTLGRIYARGTKAKRFELLGTLYPRRADTLVIDKEKRFYSRCCETCDSTCLMLQNYDMDNDGEPEPYRPWRGKWFVRGIGIVTEGTSESGYNLIEYRIGNGPVIKKRWSVPAPQEPGK